MLALKGRNHTLQHSGSLKQKSVERFVKTHGYPLLGEFSVNTYYRYNDRPGDQVRDCPLRPSACSPTPTQNRHRRAQYH